ncbi:hypothetical protein ACFFX0_04185 [Citricoccus parietis]|uniref:Uncharacterized protein n=1 Tax=Citricoccus parietis TaxID=592307 RepID=A0ABV5FVE9_9MICC
MGGVLPAAEGGIGEATEDLHPGIRGVGHLDGSGGPARTEGPVGLTHRSPRAMPGSRGPPRPRRR